MAVDPESGVTPDRDDPGVGGFIVVPNDSVEQPFIARSIYVGVGGTIICRGLNGTVDLTFLNVPNGSILPFSPQFIRVTGTTATNMIGLV